MKAIICTQYGSPEVLQLKEIETPIPKDNEIRIRIFATAVNSGDVRLRAANPWLIRLFFGLRKPKQSILGSVFSGEVESIGSKVVNYKVGDQVFGDSGMKLMSYAEYICLPEDGMLSMKPNNLSHQEASTVTFGGLTALYFLKKAEIKRGQKVLIYGASGAVGTAAVQLATYFGAEVTGVCSGPNADLVKSLGAKKVIDYTKEDFNKEGRIYDVIFVTVDKLSFGDALQSLKQDGTLLLGSASPFQMLRAMWTSVIGSRKVVAGVLKQKIEDILFLKELVEQDIYHPVVDKVFPLNQIAEAHRYVDKGHKRGNVSISIVPEK